MLAKDKKLIWPWCTKCADATGFPGSDWQFCPVHGIRLVPKAISWRELTAIEKRRAA